MPRANKSFALQQQLNACLSQYTHPFTATNTIVDIEEMGENFENGLVPITAIAQAVEIIISNNIKTPIGSKYSHHNVTCSSGELVPKDKIFTHWAFQRNTYCNNVTNIFNRWFEPCARSGKGVRLPEKYGSIVLPADSGHTSVTRIIRKENLLPFEIADIPDQGSFASTLQLAKEVAGEIFLSLNSKNVRKPSPIDIYRIAVVQKQEPQYSIHNILDPLGFKVKQGSHDPMVVHNLNDVNFLYELGKNSKGKYLQEAMDWWKTYFGNETVDPCLSASFGLLMQREDERKCSWTSKQKKDLAKYLKTKWNLIEFADDSIKGAFSEVTWDSKAQMHTITLDHNHQVMLGLAFIANKYLGHKIPIISGVDFSKAKIHAL
jgi:hypothetical protein